MYRVVLAALATVALVGVLALLIVESRSANDEHRATHAERVVAIENLQESTNTVLTSTLDAFREGRNLPQAFNSALARLVDNSNRLRSADDERPAEGATNPKFAEYDSALEQFLGNAHAFATPQNALAEALRLLQDVSPDAVKDLRQSGLREQSQDTYVMAIDVIDYATGQGSPNPDTLAERLEVLYYDADIEAQAPGRLNEYVKAAHSVLSERAAVEVALERLRNDPFSASLSALSNTIMADNRETVNRAERAQLLLAVCVVILLAGTGYVMMRLQSSYGALNRSNAELAKVNDTLEDRVTTRTEQLKVAYDELKESQVQLVQAEKMSSLGGLVAGISHEINTPLWYLINNATVVQECLNSVKSLVATAESMITSIQTGKEVKQTLLSGIADMRKALDDGMSDDLSEASTLNSESIDGLEDLTELAQSLKDFSRLDRTQEGQLNVNDGLDKTLLIAKNRLKGNITVHKHYGEIPLVYCAPSQINQVFLNLVTNAADAIDGTGEIVLRTWQEGDNVLIRVSDSGCGIPEATLSKILDPFFTTKEIGKGTGLGLSIVQRIVEAHDGELRIESVDGQGTSMTVVLPINEPDPYDDV